jgi:hypothetical protein
LVVVVVALVFMIPYH